MEMESLNMQSVFFRGPRFVVISLVCSAVIPACWSLAIPNSYSKPVQSLFQEAQATSGRPILINTVPPSSSQAFQGTTNGEADRMVITVKAGISGDYDDALLAHELLHVILNNKRFAAGGDLTPSGSRDPQRAALSAGIRLVNSCFPDELIDRESVKRGLKPQLLLDRQIELTIEGTSQLKMNEEESWPDNVRNVEAVRLFCLAKRLDMQKRHRIEQSVSRAFGKSIMTREQQLLARFKGRYCQLTQPAACYRLTVELRNAAGLKGDIQLYNPKSHLLE